MHVFGHWYIQPKETTFKVTCANIEFKVAQILIRFDLSCILLYAPQVFVQFHAVRLQNMGLDCCGECSVLGIPGLHMCALLRETLRDPVEFVDDSLTQEAAVALYDCAVPIEPIDLVMTANDEQPLLPPHEHKQRGAPRKRRIGSLVGDAPPRALTCQRCGQSGHNRRTCKVSLDGNQ